MEMKFQLGMKVLLRKPTGEGRVENIARFNARLERSSQYDDLFHTFNKSDQGSTVDFSVM